MIFDGDAEGLQYLYSRIIFVVCLDQGPWRHRGRGAIYHIANRNFVGIPLLAIAPIFLGDLELLERNGLALLEAPVLLILADCQPEFYDHRAVANHGTLQNR